MTRVIYYEHSDVQRSEDMYLYILHKIYVRISY